MTPETRPEFERIRNSIHAAYAPPAPPRHGHANTPDSVTQALHDEHIPYRHGHESMVFVQQTHNDSRDHELRLLAGTDFGRTSALLGNDARHTRLKTLAKQAVE